MEKPEYDNTQEEQFNCEHEWIEVGVCSANEDYNPNTNIVKRRICIKCGCEDYVRETPYERTQHIPSCRGDF